jgi:hypothetical protein
MICDSTSPVSYWVHWKDYTGYAPFNVIHPRRQRRDFATEAEALAFKTQLKTAIGDEVVVCITARTLMHLVPRRSPQRRPKAIDQFSLF